MKKLLLLLLCVSFILSCGEKEKEENYNAGIEIEKNNKVTPEVKDNKDSYYEIKGYKEGKKIFEGVCISCHTIGGGKTIGQDLKGVLDRRTEESIIKFVQDPTSEGVTLMPPQPLSADEIKSILEYITNYVEEEEGGSVPNEDEEWWDWSD